MCSHQFLRRGVYAFTRPPRFSRDATATGAVDCTQPHLTGVAVRHTHRVTCANMIRQIYFDHAQFRLKTCSRLSHGEFKLSFSRRVHFVQLPNMGVHFRTSRCGSLRARLDGREQSAHAHASHVCFVWKHPYLECTINFPKLSCSLAARNIKVSAA